MKEIIPIGNDHAGFLLKTELVAFLTSLDIETKDMGTFSEESVDYPDYIHPVAYAVEHNQYSRGIIICGSGNGAAMVANKYQHVRAALCWTPEIARLARLHNNANILALPARFISLEAAVDIVRIFLNSAFEGGRHTNRVYKVSCLID
jgi:ribose 5-phosphate isomerase B